MDLEGPPARRRPYIDASPSRRRSSRSTRHVGRRWTSAEGVSVDDYNISRGWHSLGQLTTEPDVLMLDNGYPAGEYLLIENRQPGGFDSMLPQGGLAVWHVDEKKGSFTWNDPNTDGGYPGGSALPPGMTLSPGGVLSGTPTVTGTYTFTVRASDPAGFYDQRELTLEVVTRIRRRTL